MQEDLSRQLSELNYRFLQQLRASPVHNELNITPLQAHLLVWSSRTEAATASKFCELTGRDRGQIARVIGQLVDASLMERHSCPQDGRVLYLKPTPRGAEYVKRLVATRDAMAKESFKGISQEDLEQLARTMAKIRANLLEMETR